jgi:hypothetical protein
MLSGIDPVVVLVRDLLSATEDYEKLGFRVTPGGEHTGGATHNALIGFRDGSYFELIAFKDPAKKQDHRWWARLAAGEGLVDYALRADKVAAVAAEARTGGLSLADPVDGHRTRPDGRQLAWRSITSGRPVGTSALPFAIEDVTPRSDRVPAGDAAIHRLGAIGVAEVVIAVRNIEAAARDLRALLGQEPELVQVGLSSARAEAVFRTGGQALRLVQPGITGTQDDAALADHLASRGEGPFEVVLELDAAAQASGLLPLTEAHEARIRLGKP